MIGVQLITDFQWFLYLLFFKIFILDKENNYQHGVPTSLQTLHSTFYTTLYLLRNIKYIPLYRYTLIPVFVV